MAYVVAAFYRFVALHNYYDMRPVILQFCLDHGIKGTVILAEQGINATIAGHSEDISKFFLFLDLDDRLSNMRYHRSYSSREPFPKMKVRLKNEVVRLGIEGFDCTFGGQYVDPEDWDEFISAPEVSVIDTRNDYEIRFGRFKGAISPGTSSFREFPAWAEEWACGRDKNSEIAMYCTGGIRCEKSTAFMKSLGFKNVYHLKGGILSYLDATVEKSGLWEGDCFVFDDRIAVNAIVLPVEDIKCVLCLSKVDLDDIRSISKGHVVCKSCKAHA